MAERLDAAALGTVSRTTIGHYDASADDFWEGTRDHDVSQNIAALLRHITGTPPFVILDFGCGPGRDLAQFRALGHAPIGLDGSPRFVSMARAFADVPVWQQDFLQLALPPAHFDGVFANATLFHVPAQELPRVLSELRASLKPGGVLFTSNPRGQGGEGWQGERYGVWHDLDAWRTFVAATGFVELEHYYRPPGRPRAQQPWLATVWRRLG